MHEFHSQLHVELQHLFGIFKDSDGTLGEWISRGYAVPDLEKKPILFVGLNPSYTTDPQPKDYHVYAPPVREEYSRYFDAYQDLANACQRGDEWDYADLFYYRETEQDKLSAVLKTPEGLDFITLQLQFTMRVFDFLRPELIVVCHPGAYQFFG